jgi:hypothetical protein
MTVGRTIDFGTEGCTLQNGNVGGKIVVSALEFCGTDKTMTISFVNFTITTKINRRYKNDYKHCSKVLLNLLATAVLPTP